jgi:hypothetical protein
VIAEVPPGVTTVTSTVPAGPAGAVTVILLVELTVNVAAAEEPKLTAETPLKLVPVIVTVVPPATGPADGLTPVTVGGLWNVNWSAVLVADVPPGEMTWTLTAPAASAGEVAVMLVAELTVKVAAGLLPMFTVVTLVKFVPVIVIVVPPLTGPAAGLTPVTVGAFS